MEQYQFVYPSPSERLDFKVAIPTSPNSITNELPPIAAPVMTISNNLNQKLYANKGTQSHP